MNAGSFLKLPNRPISLLSIVFISLILSQNAMGITKTWNGATSLWSDPSNWVPSGVPGASDSVVFFGSVPCSLTVNSTIQNLTFNSYTGSFIFGPDTLKISNTADFSGFSGSLHSYPSSILNFIGATTMQNIICPATTFDTLPGIIHSGNDTLNQTNALKCRSFLQTAGTYKINGQHDTITSGNFTISNTVLAAASFCNLDNSWIVTRNGDIVLNGHANDSINLDPANPWNLMAMSSHSISADYAKIHFCTTNGIPSTATNSHDVGSNTGFLFMNPNNKIWNNAWADGKWSTPQNWAPAGVPTPNDTVRFFTGAFVCTLNVNATIRSIKFEDPAFTGPFKFLSDTLFISDSADFSVPTSTSYIIPGNGAIEFIGPGSHSLIAKQGLPLPSIILNGGGVTTAKNAGFKAKDLHIINGTFNCGPGFIDSLTGTLKLETGTSLQLGTSNLWTWEVNTSAGNLNFGSGQMTIYGPNNINFLFDNISFTSGNRLNLQNPIGWHLFSPPALTAGFLPPIFKMGIDSLVLQGPLKAHGLILSGGAWNWGTDGRPPSQAYGHAIDSIITSGNSRMYFSSGSASDTVTVIGNLNLSGLNPVGGMFAGIGGFILNGAGTQKIYPAPGGLLLPGISHIGSGTLTLLGDIVCSSFMSNAGHLDFGHFTVNSSSSFYLTNGNSSTVLNLGGSAIQATSVAFKGLTATDTLNLNPGASWTVNVTGSGALSAENAKISYCSATGSFGYANNSVDASNNNNWKFGKFWIAHFSDSLWTSPYNWGPYGTPLSSDSVVFDNSSTLGCILDVGTAVRAITIQPSFSHAFNFGINSLSVNGDVNFSGMAGAINPGTGTLSFFGTEPQNFWPAFGQTLPNIIHSGTGTLNQNNHLKCLSFIQSNGTYNLSGNKQDTITSGNFTISNGKSTSLLGLAYCTILVQNGNAIFSGNGGPDSLYMTAASQWNVNVLGGTLTASNAVIQNCNATGSALSGAAASCRDLGANINWNFSTAKFWTNGALDNLWSTPNNWSPSGIPINSDSVVFDNHAPSANCVFNNTTIIKAITLTSAYTGNFNFAPNDTLKVLSTLDFQNFPGSITAGTGVIALNGASQQYLYPPNPLYPNVLPKIILNNFNGAKVQNNRLRTSNLTLNAGTMIIDTALTIDSIYIGLSSSLKLSNTFVRSDTATAIWGMGSFDLGWANLAVSGDLNFANMNSFSPEIAKIAFIGPNTKIFSPKAGTLFNGLEQISGTTQCATNGFITNTLKMTGGMLFLGNNLIDSIAGFSGSGGAIDFGSSTLKFSGSSLDFSPINIVANAGFLKFCGISAQAFMPNPNMMHPRIEVLSGNLMVNNNPLKTPFFKVTAGMATLNTGFVIDTIDVYSTGNLDLGSTSYNDTVKSLHGIGMLNLNNAKLYAINDVNLSGFSYVSSPSPTVSFIGAAPQAFYPVITGSPGATIIHSGSGTLTQMGNLKCASFSQTAGTYNLNGKNDTITSGDFTVSNGNSGSLTGLDNSSIVVQNGNASFSGQNAVSLLNLNPPTHWRLDVSAAGKTKTAQYAVIGNCNATGGLMAQPLYCAMALNDTNWNYTALMPQIYDTNGMVNSLVAYQRSNGNDTIDLWYKLRDPDNSVDTIKFFFRNGSTGAMNAPAIGSVTGDFGVVNSSDSSIHRHIKWFAVAQFGNSFTSDSIQIGLTANDNFGNLTPMVMTAANMRVITKSPSFSANIFILPSGGSFVAGGTPCSITWNYANISFGAQAKNYPLTLQYSIDNGTSFLMAAANLPNSGSYLWTTPLITNKNILLRFTAQDTLGNIGYGPVSLAFTIDATPPLSTITFPPNKSFVNSLTGISGIASDSVSGVKSVFVAVKNSATGNYWNGSVWVSTPMWFPTTPKSPNAWTYAGPPASLTNGSTIIVMSQAIDSANIAQMPYCIDTLIVDTIAPLSAITYPMNNSALSSLASISGTASDAGAGIASIAMSLENVTDTLYWAESKGWIKGQTWLSPAGSLTAWNYAAPPLTNGKKYLIQSTAADKANNSEVSTAGVSFTYSSSAPGSPTIAITNKQKYTDNALLSLTLSVQNADSMQFKVNSGAWSAWEPFASAKNNVSIAGSIQGISKIFAEYKDKAGNMTAPVSDSIVYDATPPLCTIFTQGVFSPATWPGYLQGMSSDSLSGVKSVGVSIKSAKTGLFWNSTAWGADSSFAPASLVNGSWKYNIGTNVLQSSVYIVKALSTDSAANNSVTVIDSINYAPTILNTLNVAFTDMGDSALAVTWKVDKTKSFMKSVLYGYKFGAVPDSLALSDLRYADSAFVISNVTKVGVAYIITGLADSAGNKSSLRIDSVFIANTPPTLTAIKDSSVFEDRAWQVKLFASDRNGDTLRYHCANPPVGFSVDSISGAMAWTPEYSNVGKNKIVVLSSDGHGGIAADTFTLTVLALPPHIAYIGDSVAHEDSLFLGRLQISNIGAGDTAFFSKTIVPSWIKIVGDTLTGVPEAQDAGKDTIIVVLSEKAGFADTLKKIITVLHTNHPPKLIIWSRPDSIYQYSQATWSFTAADTDKGDSLSVVWTIKPKWLTILSNQVQGANWKFAVSGTPTSTDVAWAPFVFSVRDTAGASFTIRDSVFIVALPTTSINKNNRQISFGAVRYTITGSDYADTSLTFQTSLRSLSDSSRPTQSKTSTGSISFYPLSDGTYEFTAQAVDRKGLKDPFAPKDTFVISGATRHVFADSLWSMISIPSASMATSLVAGSGSLLHWNESGVQSDVYSYYQKPPVIVQTMPGLSYWRKSMDTLTVLLDKQNVRDTTITIPLIKGDYGWNQIASPYPYTVKWPVAGAAWKWNNQTGDYEEANGLLDPWTGYWVAVDSSTSITLDNTPVFSTPSLAKKSSAFFADKSNWQIKIKLQTAHATDAENKLGFSRSASDGFSSFDLPKAPRFQRGRYVFFPHSDWNRPIKEYASDIRKTMQHVTVFQLAFTPSQGDTGNSQLSVEGSQNLSSVYCFLVDPKSVSPMVSGKQYPIEPSNSVLYKQIFVTEDKNFVQNFPHAFSMANPFPNPCRPTTNIHYVLPYNFGTNGLLDLMPYSVKIALYDVAGRQIRELLYHKQLPGMYHITWDGKNNSGRIVASGTYFCRLEANKFSATTRLVMMR